MKEVSDQIKILGKKIKNFGFLVSRMSGVGSCMVDPLRDSRLLTWIELCSISKFQLQAGKITKLKTLYSHLIHIDINYNFIIIFTNDKECC